MNQTAVIWDERYLLHDTGLWHPERPERLLAIKKVLDERPIGKKLIRLEPRLATPEEIAVIHDTEYIRRIQESAGHDIQLDPDTPVSPKSWEAACLAVGGMLHAVDWITGPGMFSKDCRRKLSEARSTTASKGERAESAGGRLAGQGARRTAGSGEQSGENIPGPVMRRVFAFVRPPGHHAERARAMGFCLFNNVAIAAEYALRKEGIRRILIVDYDVHHGNGTQGAFYDRADVFYISTHRYPFYPGTGARKEEGEGKGKGFTLNIPFSGGQGDEEYLKAFDQEIIPTARDFKPDIILVSAGYDAHRLDPLGGMNVTAEGFARMTAMIRTVADQYCDGKMVMVLEGGYSLQGLTESVEKCLEVI